MKIITRAEAIAQGQRSYYTGIECKHGHIAERDTVTGGCKECHRRIVRESLAKSRKRIIAIRNAVELK